MKTMQGATAKATSQFLEQHKIPQTRLGKTNWMVSPVGFGGYRVSVSEPEHEAALKHALTLGCNLIDTSTNYTNGNSERLVGRVLGKLISEKQLQRENIVVVTKAGYIQGENLEQARALESEEKFYDDVVK